VGAVTGEAVMVKTALQQPGARAGHPIPSRAAEQSAFAAHQPAAFAESLPRDLDANRADGINPPRVRFEALGEIRHVGQPVVHLDVDVRVVITAPRWIILVVPFSLQIGRQSARTRRVDH